MRILLSALAISLLCACVAPPREIALGGDAAAQPGALPITDYATAASAIAWVLTQKLDLPMPRYTMAIYGDAGQFEAALVRHLKLAPEVARSAAGYAKAAVGNRRVLVNEPAMATLGWPERIVTLAHEMVHAAQLELAGHRSLTRNQWLVEGFAEWIAFRVSHELGVNELAAERKAMIARVRAARQAGGLAPLAQMDSLDQWIAVRTARGFDATYPFAFLAVDHLIERHSYAQVIDYFRRHRESGDAAANFAAAFGEDVSRFQVGLDLHLARLLD